jgi:hypothetical protein
VRDRADARPLAPQEMFCHRDAERSCSDTRPHAGFLLRRSQGGRGTATATATPVLGPPMLGLPIEKHKPTVNGKTGEIRLEYEFPEAGQGEAYGEVRGRTVAARGSAAHRRSGTCKSSRHSGNHHGKPRKCVGNPPLRYGRVKLRVPVAGIYKVRVKADGDVFAALKRGETLDVRVELVLRPQALAPKSTRRVPSSCGSHKGTREAQSLRGAERRPPSGKLCAAVRLEVGWAPSDICLCRGPRRWRELAESAMLLSQGARRASR